MSSTTLFEITRFKYRNGTSSWRVSGWLPDVRIRKNLATREEAAVEKTCWKSGRPRPPLVFERFSINPAIDLTGAPGFAHGTKKSIAIEPSPYSDSSASSSRP